MCCDMFVVASCTLLKMWHLVYKYCFHPDGKVHDRCLVQHTVIKFLAKLGTCLFETLQSSNILSYTFFSILTKCGL